MDQDTGVVGTGKRTITAETRLEKASTATSIREGAGSTNAMVSLQKGKAVRPGSPRVDTVRSTSIRGERHGRRTTHTPGQGAKDGTRKARDAKASK